MVVPDLLNLNQSTQLHNAVGYILVYMGGVLLTLGLIIFQSLDFPDEMGSIAFLFGMVGSLMYLPALILLQELVMAVDLLTWAYVIAISMLTLLSFLCTSNVAMEAHPALVCAVLHSEVVLTLAVQHYVWQGPVTPFNITGAGVILGSIIIIIIIIIITAQNISCNAPENYEGVVGRPAMEKLVGAEAP